LIVPGLDSRIESLVRLGLIAAEPIRVQHSGAVLSGQIDVVCRELAEMHAGKKPGEIPGLQPARELYRSFGIDPTRTRPSSEALLRRVIKGKPFPAISNAVDVCNLCALEFLLSLGLYDADKISGSVSLRRGRPGEAMEGIRKGKVNLEGRLVLADEEGAFGNPTSDSLRTSLDEGTTRMWMVIFAPASLETVEMDAHLERAARLVESHLGGDVTVKCKTMRLP